ncbi:DUF1272 domain-containing protein [Sulfitobacter noctilucicola]|uniref:DUF1272 domain-containing protein n=1 Tax=Sulfitobacter noctilucicola TaxID=1342301 RepID=UPI0019D325FF
MNVRSAECTLCAECLEKLLHKVCPNCAGGFAPRVIRPSVKRCHKTSLNHKPAGT